MKSLKDDYDSMFMVNIDEVNHIQFSEWERISDYKSRSQVKYELSVTIYMKKRSSNVAVVAVNTAIFSNINANTLINDTRKITMKFYVLHARFISKIKKEASKNRRDVPFYKGDERRAIDNYNSQIMPNYIKALQKERWDTNYNKELKETKEKKKREIEEYISKSLE